MEKVGQPNRDGYMRRGMKATLPALLSKIESKSGENLFLMQASLLITQPYNLDL
jgi:hypothetical protein